MNFDVHFICFVLVQSVRETVRSYNEHKDRGIYRLSNLKVLNFSDPSAASATKALKVSKSCMLVGIHTIIHLDQPDL